MVGAGPAGSYRSPSPAAGLAIGRDGASCALRGAACCWGAVTAGAAWLSEAQLVWWYWSRRRGTQVGHAGSGSGTPSGQPTVRRQRPGRLGCGAGRSLIRLAPLHAPRLPPRHPSRAGGERRSRGGASAEIGLAVVPSASPSPLPQRLPSLIFLSRHQAAVALICNKKDVCVQSTPLSPALQPPLRLFSLMFPVPRWRARRVAHGGARPLGPLPSLYLPVSWFPRPPAFVSDTRLKQAEKPKAAHARGSPLLGLCATGGVSLHSAFGFCAVECVAHRSSGRSDLYNSSVCVCDLHSAPTGCRDRQSAVQSRLPRAYPSETRRSEAGIKKWELLHMSTI